MLEEFYKATDDKDKKKSIVRMRLKGELSREIIAMLPEEYREFAKVVIKPLRKWDFYPTGENEVVGCEGKTYSDYSKVKV